jgi:ribosomal peptide maturation radical SAM protein 1
VFWREVLKLGNDRAIALVSTPWPLFNRPSIQLGSLKASLQKELPCLAIHTHHLYLNVAESLDYKLYREISKRNWLAESVYAALLYPEKFESIETFWWRKSFIRSLFPPGCDFHWLCREVQEVSGRLLNSISWHNYLLAGFSVCFGQLTSSLYFIREIRSRVPGLKIVVGGSSCAGEMGESLLQVFPEIDFVVQGEGELPLAHLVNALSQGRSVPDQLSLSGVLARPSSGRFAGATQQVARMDDLPSPLYDDYFQTVYTFPPEKRFFPKIPVEMSRGCWWRKESPTGKRSGCAFCNLDLQWEGYRSKTPSRVISEVDGLSEKHQVLSIAFTDNLLPAKGLKEIFQKMISLGKELRFFAEIRATTPRHVLAAMGAAGTETVQVGVEALSTSLLNKLSKGTTAMTNLQIMRDCEIPGLPNLTGNLITRFPSSDETDVSETLATLAFASPFRPLKPTPFWLGYASPVFGNPRIYGIRIKGNHHLYGRMFPAEIHRGLKLMIQEYSGQKRYQRRIWKRVEEKVREWRETYEELRKAPGSGPILSYLDGKKFMIIRQLRLGRDPMTHRLAGTSRNIYLLCQSHRSIREIMAQSPGLQEDRLLSFLDTMVDKHLMFNEGDRYLSLAVPSPHAFS